MGSLLSGLSEIFPYLVNLTTHMSIMICIIFIIKFIAAKRLPAWWDYGMWLLLLVPIFLMRDFQYRLKINDVVPGSFKSIVFNNDVFLSRLATGGGYHQRFEWNIPIDRIQLYLWLAGVLTFGTFIVTKNIRFWMSIRREPSVRDKDAVALLEECKGRLQIRKNVKIIVTDRIKSPALFGYFHPRLLLPKGIFENFRYEELAYVFMHEMVHLKRHDIAVSCVITLFQTIQWFNPLVWLAFYQMRIDQEASCDEFTLSRLNNDQSIEYANTIIGFLEKCRQNNPLPSLACIMESKDQVKRRLFMIVNYRRFSKKITGMALVLIIVMGFVSYAISGLIKDDKEKPLWNDTIQGVMKNTMTAIQKRDFNDLEKILTDYLDSDPEFIPGSIYVMLANLYDHENRQDDALNILKKGHVISPENSEINEGLMKCYARLDFENNRFIEAGRCYERLYERYPESNRNTLETAAISYFKAGRTDEAERIYRKMVELSSEGDVIWLERLIRTSVMLGFNDQTECFKRELGEIGVYSNLLTTDEDKGRVYELSEVDEQPMIISQIDPIYPLEAEKRKMSGRVTLRFIVTSEGLVTDSSVVDSEPKGIFYKSALDAVRQYRFKPATKDGVPVDVLMTAPMDFVYCYPLT